MADDVKVVRIIVDASRAVDGSAAATRALANMERSLSDTANGVDKLEKALGKVGFWLKGQIVIMATDLGSRLAQMAKDSFNAAAGLGELAEQLGISARSLQGMQFAATQAGIKTEELETAVSKFNQKMGEAAAGSKPMLDALNALGVKILDAQGKLRPTETLLQDVARAIMAMDDPAKRAAASVDFFGKSGAKMQTVLAEMAKGLDGMAARAKAASAIISDEAIAKLDKLADSGEKSKLQMRALFAESAAGPLTQALDLIHGKLENLQKIAKAASKDIGAFLMVAANIPFFAGQAMQPTEREGVQSAINKAQSKLTSIQQDLSVSGLDDRRRGILEAEQSKVQSQIEGLQRQQQVLSVSGKVRDGDYETGGTPLGTQKTGKSNPPAVGGGGGSGGETPEQKYAKLTIKLQEAAKAQDEMTAAAARGDLAFTETQVHLDAVQKTLEIFGRRLADNDPLLVEMEARLLRIAQGKAAEAFSLATNELQNQNAVLETQIRLRGEAPELIAKEVAALKVKADIEKAGGKISQDEIDRRFRVVEVGEKLKIQAEELRKAQELWTAPLKRALEDIQSTAANAFETMLESGKFTFESLGQAFGKIVRQMAAQFLALATIRPVLSVLVNAVGGAGMASQFGLGGGSGGGIGSLFGGGGTSIGGGGTGSLFSGGGFLGGIGDFLNTPLTGPYAGMSPSSMAGVPMLSPSWSNPASWGITPLQGIGAAAGAGMGILQLINSKSTAGTIGGISSILGAGVSLIPGIGQIAGPLIALAGNILPGLFGLGEKPPTITDQTYGQLRYSSNGWFTNGGAWGPNANSSQTEQSLAGLGGSISNVFALLGGVKDPQKVWGLSAQNRTDQGGNWSSSSTSSFLVDPSGNQQLWRMNESNMWDTGSAQVAWRSIIEGAVGDITDNLRNALTQVGQTMGGTSLQAIAQTVQEVKAFDDAIAGLGKTTSTVEQALAQIDAQFAAIYATADKYGFSTSQVDAAKQAERLKFATGFGDSIQRSINDLTDPRINQLADLDKWRTEAIKTNDDILKNVTGALDQINKIEELYALQRAQIVANSNDQLLKATEQAARQQIETLQQLIRSLTPGGALSNGDPRTQFAGLAATYNATRAQAFAGDAAARDRFAQDATSYAQFARSFFAGSSDYNAIRDQIIRDASSLQVTIGGGGTGTATTGSASDAASAAVAANMSRLMAIVDQQAAQINQLMAELSRTNALLQRYVANAA